MGKCDVYAKQQRTPSTHIIPNEKNVVRYLLCGYVCICMYVSIYPSIYVFMYLCIYVSIYLSIYQSIYLSIYLSPTMIELYTGCPKKAFVVLIFPIETRKYAILEWELIQRWVIPVSCLLVVYIEKTCKK